MKRHLAICKRMLFLAAVLLSGARPSAAGAPWIPADAGYLHRPVLFEPGIISTPDDDMAGAFTPDGKEFYFTRWSPTTTTLPVSVICVSRFENGRWSSPEIASFSGIYFDSGPRISPDGSRLVFASIRPVDGKPRQDADLWMSVRKGTQWSEPKNLGPALNSEGNDQNPSFAADGTLYFASSRAGGKGSYDIYRARPSGDSWSSPENLGDGVNTQAPEAHPAIAPDQSFLLFMSVARPDALTAGGSPYPQPDLYISLRKEGVFQPARNLGPPVNSTALEGYPFFSPDGKLLFFTSERGFAEVPVTASLTAAGLDEQLASVLNGRGNIYAVALAALGLGESSREEVADLKGASWGAPAEISTPRLLEPGVISTPDDEFGGAFSPDGREFFFSRSVPRSRFYLAAESRFVDGHWQRPEIASFSGRYRDSDPMFSLDGNRLYFVSDRPHDGVDAHNFDVWFAERRGSGWSDAVRAAGPLNSAQNEYFVSFASDGSIYFTSARIGSLGGIDAYRAKPSGDGWGEPENLGPPINGKEYANIEAYIAPDQSFLLLGSYGRTEDGNCHLFVSYNHAVKWGEPKPLTKLNTAAREYSPRLTPDGRYLIFTSERGVPTMQRDRPWTMDEFDRAVRGTLNGLGNIYVVSLSDVLPPDDGK